MALFTRRRAREESLAFFFASDIHGSELCWRKFVKATEFYRADLLILGGDFTGKLVIPIVDDGSGTYRARYLEKDHELTAANVREFEQRVANQGFYPTRVDPDRYTALEADRGEVDRLFEELIKERLIDWIAYAKDQLAGSGVRILTAPANDDPFSIDPLIEERGGGVFVNVEDEIIEIAHGHEMISTGWTNPTPWNTPREFPEDAIYAHVAAMADRIENVDTAIFNLHPPPFDSSIDSAPLLSADLEVQTAAGAPVMMPVGSTAVRRIIDEYQPLLSLHGHIHESGGAVKLGRTLAINPGSEYGEGVLRGALVRIGGGRIHTHQATSG